jgi:solute carrier family 50 protein (sugar transporter)
LLLDQFSLWAFNIQGFSKFKKKENKVTLLTFIIIQSVKTAFNLYINNSVGDLSLLPFISLLTNCFIWSYYGLLTKDQTVLIPNLFGILSGAACVTAYQAVAKSVDVLLYGGSFFIIFFSTLLLYLGNFKLLGSLGCILCVILMGSPLATLRIVLRDKSTASLPFGISFTNWCNSLSWSLYGVVLAKDALVIIKILDIEYYIYIILFNAIGIMIHIMYELYML